MSVKVVGEGAYGRVMMARDTETAEGRPVAIKEFKVSDDDPDAEEVRRTSRREVALLKVLNHPHIVKYLNEFYDQENKLFVVMEFVPRNLLEVKSEPSWFFICLLFCSFCAVFFMSCGPWQSSPPSVELGSRRCWEEWRNRAKLRW